jgi:UDP-N-acetylglucosamine 2-epimerase (non-hydrolysing)
MVSVVDALRKLSVDHQIVYAAQHYDWAMAGQFFEELSFPRPDHYLRVGSGSQALQTSQALVGIEKVILEQSPAAVLVEGDTNTVLAAALASIKMHVPVYHVEAGLRSFDLRMPEEHNRRLVDHMSSLLFCPTSHSAENLRGERVWGSIFVTGNTVIDACLKFMSKAVNISKILDSVKFDSFALATFHRAENVDDSQTLSTLVKIMDKCPIPVVFPVHPRTMQRLKMCGVIRKLKRSRNVQLLPPAGYFDFLNLMTKCSFILTDSGGIQEEATAPNIRKFVFVFRKRTERPESIQFGFAKLVGTDDCDSILNAIRSHIRREVGLRKKSPYGDGQAGLRTAKLLKRLQNDFFQRNLTSGRMAS